MAINYKISGDGVQEIESGAFIPPDPANKDWVEYQEWLLLDNTALPEFTQQEIDDKIIMDEILSLKADLKNTLQWLFRMSLEIWDVGVTKGLWDNTDITDVELKQKVVDWKTKLDRLNELGE